MTKKKNLFMISFSILAAKLRKVRGKTKNNLKFILRFARFVVTLQPISKKRLMKIDKKQNQYRTNEQIRAREVRIVGESGSTVMPTRQALDLAHQQGVDLVEISPNADPPVCRLIDFSKFLYQQKKRQKEMKAKQVKVEVKEIRFGPQTDEHDYQFKLKHAQEFLQDGNKVRAYVFFRGRSILFKEQGEVLLLRFANDLEEVGKVESMPSLEGKKMFLYLAPKKAGSAKKSQQARDREAAVADEKKREERGERREESAVLDIDTETPANGGLLANAKISADALKKLTETESPE